MASNPADGKRKLLLLFGSETGNSESISKRIHHDANELGYTSDWASLKDFKNFQLDKLEAWPKHPIIFVTSSTGDGNPPENAETFWRQLRRKPNGDGTALKDVRFIILGLGDSNYDNYQGFPSALYGKLTQLGARPIIEMGKADEATGTLEDYVEPWIADLWPDLDEYFTRGKILDISSATHEQAKDAETLSTSTLSSTTSTTASTPMTMSPESVLAHQPSESQKVAEPAPKTQENTENAKSAPAPAAVPPVVSAPVEVIAPVPARIIVTTDANAILNPAKEVDSTTATATTASTVSAVPSTAQISTSTTQEAQPSVSVTATTPVVGLTPIGTPASRPGSRTPGPVAPKAPIHVSKVKFVENSTQLAPRFAAAVFPPTKEAPQEAQVVHARILTSPDAVKEIWEVTLKINAGEILPGDAIGVWPQNCPEMTERLLKALHLTKEEMDRPFVLESLSKDPKLSVATIKVPTTMRQAFQNSVNFTGLVSKRVLVMLAQYCTQEASKIALNELANDKAKYKNEIEFQFASVLDILERFPDCKPDIGHLFDSLSALMPRYYSIANYAVPQSSKEDKSSTFRFIFSTEHTILSNKTFLGVATSWFKRALAPWAANGCQGPLNFVVPVFVRPRTEFILPSDLSRPIILCSAGTGLAPFMGFLQQRRYITESKPEIEMGKAVLFTGHRHPNKDWIYHEEVTTTKLPKDVVKTAFSRLEPGKVEYVQHLISEPAIASELIKLMLQGDAVFYICGDAKTMASAVRETLLAALQAHGKMDAKAASDKILEWAKAKRYLLDIWG